MRKLFFAITFVSFVSCLYAASAAPVAFTYQGRLFNSGDPVDGPYTMTFKAFDSVTSGTQVGSTISVSQVSVTNGYFQQLLDFGPNIPRGIRIWLEITIKKYNTAETPAILTPRQELTPAPIALYAQKAGSLAADLPMINQVVRLDVEGRGTFFFDQMINFIPQIQRIPYEDPGTGQIHWNPGQPTFRNFQLVRYATNDDRFWQWKDELIEQPAAADCDLYVIDTRTGRTIDAWHFTDVYPQQFLLEPDDLTQVQSVVEKITFNFHGMQLHETGATMGWERPPVPTIKLPARLILLPSQEERFDFFEFVGWKFTEIQDPIGYHLEFEVLVPSFYRASSGSSYIARLFEDIDRGQPWQRQQMALPLYDSRGDLVFAIEMAECWPFEVRKFFYSPKDKMMERISFAIEGMGYSQ